MKMTTALLAASALLLPALAHANQHYHVKLCNESNAALTVSYKPVKGLDQIGNAKPDGITHHSRGDELAAGKCAKLSFEVKYGGMASLATLVFIDFFAGDGHVELSFSGVKHEARRMRSSDPKGLAFHVAGSGEHVTIDVRGTAPKEPKK